MNGKLKLGVSTAAFFPLTLEETFDILAQQPWNGIELMPQSPEECFPAFADELYALSGGRFEFCGIHFPQILAPFLYNPYPSAFEFGQEICRGLGELAGALKCTTIVIHGPWANMSKGAFMEATLANLRLLCDTAIRHDVIIGLENTPGSPNGSSPETMIAFAAQIDRPNVGYTFDVTHTYQMNQDPMVYLRDLPSIAHVHASDFNTETNQRHTPPGQGVVDWNAVIGALWDRGFAGNFILELLWDTLQPDPVKALQESTALLNPLFARWKETTGSA
ncbi:MAG: sugar phosphate isomerase/epimerase [Chloroflexi bacterium]|nr:sugar phosphate isomerase/epimerase [Chloroflexota bacterium]